MGFLLKLCVCVLCFAVIIGIPGILWLHCLPHGRRRDNRRRAASGASSIQTKIINRNCYANSLLVLCMPVSESLRSPLICPRKVMGCDVWPAPTPPDTKEAAAKGSPHASCRRGGNVGKGFPPCLLLAPGISQVSDPTTQASCSVFRSSCPRRPLAKCIFNNAADAVLSKNNDIN